MARRIRVLIAEDHEDTRKGYAAYLEYLGMDVRTAQDGAAAVKTARRWKPDVAVLDLSMPNVTGDEAARAIREHRADEIAIIVLSGYADFGERRALEAGADEYRSKPCLPAELAAIIKRLAQVRLEPDGEDSEDIA